MFHVLGRIRELKEYGSTTNERERKETEISKQRKAKRLRITQASREKHSEAGEYRCLYGGDKKPSRVCRR